MSYQVLARKYRPKTFHDVVGQDHAVRALVHALDRDRLHHAYMFTGTRGVGKTTIARIFAKCLNCEQGVSSTPCGECTTCLEIAEGRHVDLIEVDAASRTRVDDTRELLDNVQYLPTRGRYKVYLIDEVHMLSTSSFNALLKTLEEPPEHVKFLLATTDPKKVPVTVLSRCLPVDLKNILPAAIVGHLEDVLKLEEIDYEAAGLEIIAEAAAGSMRDALSLTDQAVAHGGGAIREVNVAELLGTVRRDEIAALLSALAENDKVGLLRCAAELAERNADFAGVLANLQRAFHDIALTQVVGTTDAGSDTYDRFADAFSPDIVQLYYQIALLSGRDLQFSPDARVGFEMCLIRMLAFEPAPDGTATLPFETADTAAVATSTTSAAAGSGPHPSSAALAMVTMPGDAGAEIPGGASNDAIRGDAAQDGLVQGLATPSLTNAARGIRVDTPVAVAPAEPPAVVHAAATAVAATAPVEVTTVAERFAASEPSAMAEPSTPALPEPSAALEPAALEPTTAAEPKALIDGKWHEVVVALRPTGVAKMILEHSVPTSREADVWSLVLDDSHDTLLNDAQRSNIEGLVERAAGHPVRVSITTGSVTETPAARSRRIDAERQRQALEALESDVNVRSLLTEFDARLDRVRPLAEND